MGCEAHELQMGRHRERQRYERSQATRWSNDHRKYYIWQLHTNINDTSHLRALRRAAVYVCMSSWGCMHVAHLTVLARSRRPSNYCIINQKARSGDINLHCVIKKNGRSRFGHCTVCKLLHQYFFI